MSLPINDPIANAVAAERDKRSRAFALMMTQAASFSDSSYRKYGTLGSLRILLLQFHVAGVMSVGIFFAIQIGLLVLIGALRYSDIGFNKVAVEKLFRPVGQLR